MREFDDKEGRARLPANNIRTNGLFKRSTEMGKQ
jgi:hypothetical protein